MTALMNAWWQQTYQVKPLFWEISACPELREHWKFAVMVAATLKCSKTPIVCCVEGHLFLSRHISNKPGIEMNSVPHDSLHQQTVPMLSWKYKNPDFYILLTQKLCKEMEIPI